jgi:hypothetical protein
MVQRKSLWDRKRAEWHRDAARTRIGQAASWLLWVFGLTALVLASYAFSHLAMPMGWVAMALVLGCLATLQGLRTGKEWARWVGGTVAAALFGIQLVGLALSTTEALLSLRGGASGLLTVVWGSIALRLLGPGGRELFATARGES